MTLIIYLFKLLSKLSGSFFKIKDTLYDLLLSTVVPNIALAYLFFRFSTFLLQNQLMNVFHTEFGVHPGGSRKLHT